MHYMYFIHGKIYFIVDEIAIDSCETIYSTKELRRPRAYSIHNAQVNLSVLLKLWWTVFGRVEPILGGTDFAVTVQYMSEEAGHASFIVINNDMTRSMQSMFGASERFVLVTTIFGDSSSVD